MCEAWHAMVSHTARRTREHHRSPGDCMTHGRRCGRWLKVSLVAGMLSRGHAACMRVAVYLCCRERAYCTDLLYDCRNNSGTLTNPPPALYNQVFRNLKAQASARAAQFPISVCLSVCQCNAFLLFRSETVLVFKTRRCCCCCARPLHWCHF